MPLPLIRQPKLEDLLNDDQSNGWESVAERFIALRSSIGATTLRTWSQALPDSAEVLDLGCGFGAPITELLVAEGHRVFGVDASPTLLAAMQRQLPAVRVACEPVEESRFFDQKFDGVVAIGLIFLLTAEVQPQVIRRVAKALKPQGRFLFTAPIEATSWDDLLTGRQSVSLGEGGYRRALEEAGLVIAREYDDEGGNHYYDAVNAQPIPIRLR